MNVSKEVPFNKFDSISTAQTLLPFLAPQDIFLDDVEIPNKKIYHCDRINFIYLNKILGKDKVWISNNLHINYSTVQYIIKTFEKYGRTNKKQFLNIDYIEGTSQIPGRKAKMRDLPREGKLGRGRKKLDMKSSILLDAFAELTPGCPLKLFVDQDSGSLKTFTDK